MEILKNLDFILFFHFRESGGFAGNRISPWPSCRGEAQTGRGAA